MITIDNLRAVLKVLQFQAKGDVYIKHFEQGDFDLKVDFAEKKIIYPEAVKISGEFTTNFSSNENFVVLECVHRLLEKGYKPEHLELEPKWDLGRGASGGRADIFVRDQTEKPLLMIECKTEGQEFAKEWKEMQVDGGQLFSYIEQEKAIEFVCLYASGFDEATQQITNEQRIISHKDNAQILKDNDHLKGFKDAKNVKERFKVWKETYQLEYTEKGIFEDNIQAYQIGKDKYALDVDTKEIDASDKKGKYHQFRTILRKHNVSRRENAFEVLVNLFLCKIVDEQENPQDLKFYWKGIAYDSYYDLVDRLQALYKIGMERFLEQDIMYISNTQIDEVFWAFKQKRNATKKEIKKIFWELKFYNDNAFGLISVRNKETFIQNAKVLLELIQMWQGLRLKTESQNQFLGDMFEFFLDNGIKQSEGQFFTPVPICKFIVMSLPLENQVQSQNEPLKAIDYACGSGHFLTEYALQIKPLVQKHKQAEPHEYYKNIYGIEKEDRLAKVAKVSAFMYGQQEIKIKDADALAFHDDIKEASFDVLVANPPFAVEDFLMTLPEAAQERYTLMDTVANIGNNNIQCFFLERAKQLLKGNGVTGIVVPSSVLSNSDAMHIRTREILLQHFDFVSIVELGSNTFGKTGTNTVVLFLRRKAQRPEPAEHFRNRTLDFFENWDEEQTANGGAYLDADVIRRYCQHTDLPFDAYQTLLRGAPSEALLETEMFKDYTTEFEKSTETKKLKERFQKQLANLEKTILAELQRKQKTQKTTLTAEQLKAKVKQVLPERKRALEAEQRAQLEQRFLQTLRQMEQEKVYYFMLANANPQKVLLVKSPADNKEQKQFLGYEWSGSKGNEGIKYNGGETVYDIQTPMFDPQNPQNPNKINFYLQQNFQGNAFDIPEPLQPFMQRTPLVDLLDFSRKDFNKAFSLTPKNMKPIKTKWDYIKISEAFLEVRNGKNVIQSNEQGSFRVSRIETISTGTFDLNATKWTNDKVKENDFLQRGDILFSHINSVSHLAKTAMFNLDTKIVHGANLLRFRANPNIINAFFVAEIFKLNDFTNEIKAQAQKAINQASVNVTYLNEIYIPLPPLDVQQRIVEACEAIDAEVQEAESAIAAARAAIEEKMNKVFETYEQDKIENLNQLLKRGKSTKYGTSSIQIIKSGQARGYTTFDFTDKYFAIEGFNPLDRKLQKGDLLINSTGVGTAGRVTLFDLDGHFSPDSHITIFRVNQNILSKFALYCLAHIGFKTIEKMAHGATGQIELSLSIIANIKIPVPPLEVQESLVAKIEAEERRIAEAQRKIAEAPSRKEAVMQEWL